MAKWALVRVDNRMIHGQVAAGWIGKSNAENIVVIDTETAHNELMMDILSLAVPFGIDFSILTEEEGIAKYQEEGFGLRGTMLVFKDILTAYNCIKAGFDIESLQIGGTGARPGAVSIEGTITVTEEEVHLLDELCTDGVHVYLQQTTQSRQTNWTDAKKKLK
ncbi:MAG: PTS sugar transporter subunit IIB [Dorea sp.]|nr:PTS sugar transporter subunit IIB [Dorea sp.]